MELKRVSRRLDDTSAWLLIVPCGIETKTRVKFLTLRSTFNRTLWNWNRAWRRRSCRRVTFNRTLWNWNLPTSGEEQRESGLLIVPCGIETPYFLSISAVVLDLLIVPCGIETSWLYNTRLASFLLIVPCGIETKEMYDSFITYDPFNRTLWNWNKERRREIKQNQELLIVPCGIETTPSFLVRLHAHSFNRTLWNWNKKLTWVKLNIYIF